jgi:hypothetical protein
MQYDAYTEAIIQAYSDVVQEIVTVEVPPTLLLLDVSVGKLVHRIEAIAEAALVAKASSRILLIHWEPNTDCNVSFEQILDVERGIPSNAFLVTNSTHWQQLVERATVIDSASKTPHGLDVFQNGSQILWIGDGVYISPLIAHPQQLSTLQVKLETGIQLGHLDKCPHAGANQKAMIAKYKEIVKLGQSDSSLKRLSDSLAEL